MSKIASQDIPGRLAGDSLVGSLAGGGIGS